MQLVINKVRGYRKMMNLSQKDLAEMLGISIQSYSNREKGVTAFRDEEKKIMKELFKEIDETLTIDDIFF